MGPLLVKYKNLLSFRSNLKLLEKALRFFEKMLVSPNLVLDLRLLKIADLRLERENLFNNLSMKLLKIKNYY